jgi:hypothetical protein
MQETLPPQIPKWPFYLSDAILLAAAGFIVWQGTLPLGRWEILGSLCCVILGAVIAIFPFILEYQAITRLSEAVTLAEGLERIQHAQTIAQRIAEATNNCRRCMSRPARPPPPRRKFPNAWRPRCAIYAVPPKS